MPKTTHPKYMLIDGNALVHRGFHAIPGLQNKAGTPTGAVYGFISILLKAIKDLKPTHVAATFDLAGPTFRHEKYKDYKATRVKAPQELYDQIPLVKQVVRAMGIPVVEKQGFEADDCLGTLSNKICSHKNGGCDVMIVTGDLDTLQLVSDCVKIYTLRKGLSDIAIYDKSAIKERFGLTPEQMVDYKALRGDPSDNIKGVKGIGEKTASDLIQEFGSLDALYKAIHAGKTGDKIKPRILELLKAGEEDAKFSYELSTIERNIDIDANIPEFTFTKEEQHATLEVFKELEFQSLVSKLPGADGSAAVSTKSPKNAQTESEEEVKKPALSTEVHKKTYHFVNTEEKLDDLLSKLNKVKEFAIDTETTSIHPVDAKLVGVSVSFKAHTGYYIPANILELRKKEFGKILNDPKVSKVGHNIKYDLLTLQNFGLNLVGADFDTMLASYLLDPGTRKHSMDALAFNELGYQTQSIEELIGKGSKQITMDQVDPEKVSWYASEDADVTWQFKEIFEPRLKKEKLDKVFSEIEMPLIPVLAEVERNGVILDTELLEEYEYIAEKAIHSLEKEIYHLTGEEFNIASPAQMKEVLFEKLKLEPIQNKKTKTGLSTAAGELEKMLGQHPVIEKIMEYRELTKLQSTYITALPKLVSPTTGRIHTSYNQTIAATGRLSSTDPNLQNIPIKDNRHELEIRKAFVAEPGYKLLSIDYSQIELRMVAHLSGDKNMLEVFKKGEDIHTNTASQIFGVPKSEVTKAHRRDAKTINFGILYGLSGFGLSSRIQEIDMKDAQDFINKYFEAYPGIKVYMEKVKEEVRENGFVRNEIGRIRRFPEIKSSQFFIRSAAERAAINFPIQSLAADVIKLAMLKIHPLLSSSAKAGNPDCRMILQVHDELVFEVKEKKVKEYEGLLKPLMEQAIKLTVPITVESKIGDNWGDMK